VKTFFENSTPVMVPARNPAFGKSVLPTHSRQRHHRKKEKESLHTKRYKANFEGLCLIRPGSCTVHVGRPGSTIKIIFSNISNNFKFVNYKICTLSSPKISKVGRVVDKFWATQVISTLVWLVMSNWLALVWIWIRKILVVLPYYLFYVEKSICLSHDV
jgi:hypothetical protein